MIKDTANFFVENQAEEIALIVGAVFKEMTAYLFRLKPVISTGNEWKRHQLRSSLERAMPLDRVEVSTKVEVGVGVIITVGKTETSDKR